MLKYFSIGMLLMLICNACVNPKVKGEIFFNSSRIMGLDSSRINICLNGNSIFDTIVRNKKVDMYYLIAKIFITEVEKNSIQIKVNNRDTSFTIPDFNKDFKLFFYYDNKERLRNKVLFESSILPNRNRKIEDIRDSLYVIYGNSLDSLHFHFKHLD